MNKTNGLVTTPADLFKCHRVMVHALENVVWKLNRNTDKGMATIDRNDAVVELCREALDLARKTI